MGPPLRSFAADAHDCIMVRVSRPTEYKDVTRLIRVPQASSPSDRHPDHSKRAVVLGAVKARPAVAAEGAASPDRSCARRRFDRVGRGEETGFQVEQRNFRFNETEVAENG
jgi:hypothetical protein